MKTFLTTIATISILCSLNLGQNLAAPFESGFYHPTWLDPTTAKTADPADNPIQLVQDNLWNPDYLGKKGPANERGARRNDSNNRPNNSNQNQMWNPDYRKGELRRHNDMNERRAIREQVYDGIFAPSEGSTSNNQGTQTRPRGR